MVRRVELYGVYLVGLGHVDCKGPSTTSGGLSVLSANANLPCVTESSVETDLLHPLDIFPQLSVKVVSNEVEVLSGLPVLPAVEEPSWDIKLERVGHNSLERLNLVVGELTSALAHIDLSLLDDDTSHTTTDSSNLGDRVHDRVLSEDVGSHQTQKRRELVFLND